jgi:hypothetical protein
MTAASILDVRLLAGAATLKSRSLLSAIIEASSKKKKNQVHAAAGANFLQPNTLISSEG